MPWWFVVLEGVSFDMKPGEGPQSTAGPRERKQSLTWEVRRALPSPNPSGSKPHPGAHACWGLGGANAWRQCAASSGGVAAFCRESGKE